jgi:Papain family cysteine protease
MRNLKSKFKYVSMAMVGLALSVSSCQNDRSLTEDVSNVTPKSNGLNSTKSGRTSYFSPNQYLNSLAAFRPDLSQAEIDKQVKVGANAKLPSTWLLPRPNAGYQGDYSNCTGWSASYCGLSSLLYSFHPHIKNMPNGADKWHAAARSYSYPYFYANMTDGKKDDGAEMDKMLNALVERGSMSLLARPGADPSIVPTAQEQKDALEYRLGSWKQIQADANQMKYFLSKNYPILMSIAAGDNFEALEYLGANAILSDFDEETEKNGHAVCIVGYDKSKGFLIQNSHGADWGDKGRFWVKDEDVAKIKELYVMFPKVN